MVRLDDAIRRVVVEKHVSPQEMLATILGVLHSNMTIQAVDVATRPEDVHSLEVQVDTALQALKSAGLERSRPFSLLGTIDLLLEMEQVLAQLNKAQPAPRGPFHARREDVIKATRLLVRELANDAEKGGLNASLVLFPKKKNNANED